MTDTVIIEMPSQGPQGPQGIQGEIGPQGDRGLAGIGGVQGITGEKGDIGSGFTATSVSSLTLASVGQVSLTTQVGLAYTFGARVRLTYPTDGSWMEGTIASYSSVSGSMAVDLDLKAGTDGTYTEWNINPAGVPGTLEGVTLGTIASQDADDVVITGGVISGMPTPNNPNDVATKAYVDSLGTVPATRTIFTSGIAQGGGNLSVDRTIDVPIATQTEAQTGSDNTKGMTPLRTWQAIQALQLIKQVATQGEAEAGTENTKGMTPLRTSQAISRSGSFPSGTTMLFIDAAAPTGWTRVTGYHDRALRITDGGITAGGVHGFSGVFGRTTTDGHYLTADEQASMSVGGYTLSDAIIYRNDGSPQIGWTSGIPSSAGLNQTAHNITGTAYGGGNWHAHNIDLRVAYLDTMIARKN